MALDSDGNAVQFGDYMNAAIGGDGGPEPAFAIVRIIKLSETPKGVAAIGAYVDLVGNGRIAKVPVDIATATLVMRSNGEVVS